MTQPHPTNPLPASWIAKLVKRAKKSGISFHREDAGYPGAVYLELNKEDWERFARHCVAKSARFAGLWGLIEGERIRVNAVYAKDGHHVLACVYLPYETVVIDSIAFIYPAASRFERAATDMVGIRFANSPDNRRWIRHCAWEENEHPLRPDFRASEKKRTPSDHTYPFHKVEGDAVYEIPVGPIHAGIIEPGHFRFQAVGETVLHLEERLGYVHKGVERLAQGMTPESLITLAGRVSGDSTVAHSWAAAQAIERALGIEVPERGLFVRAILCESERVANHLGDIGAICNDVGFAFAQMQFSRLRENWTRVNQQIFGHRLLMDRICVGGVLVDLPEEARALLREEIAHLRTEFYRIVSICMKNQSLRDRLFETGRLDAEIARQLGCLGYVARASGLSEDLRVDQPYMPYHLVSVTKSQQSAGDVAARVSQRIDEVYASFNTILQLVEKIPHGPLKAKQPVPCGSGEAIGLVEGWRGEILCHVQLGQDGRVSRFFPRDPSWFNWLALEQLIHDNIVPDFPVCNKSVNGSYSGHDL